MMRILYALSVLLLAPACLASAPQVRVETRLEPASGSVVGQTIQLQVDIFTDTWFTSAPVLPLLEVDKAVVSPPSGEARHLNVKRDGQAFFGLAFSYQITPSASGNFAVPPLAISVTPGQASAPVTVRSEALAFTVEQPAGVAPGETVLVARRLTLAQEVLPSGAALRVGDSLRREVTMTADGAQMMLMPAAPFAAVDGLKLYVASPRLTPLDDGRGQVLGAQRLDSANYVVQQTGDFVLPAIRVPWWDSEARQLRSAQLPAITFKAAPGETGRVPFSVREDLKRMGQHSRVAFSRHALIWSILALAALAVCYVAWPWLRRGRSWWDQQRLLRRRRWMASPGYAHKHIADQARGQPPRLDALYMWVRWQYGATGLVPVRPFLPTGFIRALYGPEPQPGNALDQLLRSAVLRPRITRVKPAETPALRPLNPRTPEPEQRHVH